MKSASVTGKSKTRRPTKVSPRIKELLEEHARDDLIMTYPPRVVNRIGEVLLKGQRDRRYSWSASGAGRCKRSQEFAFMGMPAKVDYDPQLKRIFLNGTWVHLRNQAVLMTAGLLDNIEVTIRKPSMRARCTMDGMGEVQGGRYDGAAFGFELKSANDWSYQHQMTKGAAEKTRQQVDFEFWLSGLDLFVIFNENKNNQGTHEWVIVRDEDRVKEAAKEVAELQRAIEKQSLHEKLPECKKKLRSGEWFACPFGGDGGVCDTAGTWPSHIPSK